MNLEGGRYSALLWQSVVTPRVGARHRVSTRQDSCPALPGAQACGFFFILTRTQSQPHTFTHIPVGAVPPPLATDALSSRNRLQETQGREDIPLGPCFDTYSHISSYMSLPQATACFALINLPFIESPHPSPNTNAPLRASIKPAIMPQGALGHAGRDAGRNVRLTPGSFFAV